ncbi:MAG: phage terminase large subunit [Blastocatellia bacterium]|nr:phage terminase large subunit [Blastocatellia bacterium]
MIDIRKSSFEPADRLVAAAVAAAVPREQLERFLRFGYVPQPKQLQFHSAARECDLADGPTEIGYGGVRGESKTHAAVAQVMLDDCQRIEGLKFLWVRKVGKAVRESFNDLRRRLLMRVAHDYRAQSGVIELTDTGATVVLGHFKHENDIDNYLGLEYDGILIEEATQLSAAKHRDIKTCRRTSKTNWRPRTYYTFNPGGVGHAHIKQLLYTPYKNENEIDTRFIFARRGDNRFIDSDYQKSLDDLVGWQRKAWRDGDMEIAAGQFFTNWRHEKHVFNHGEFELLSHWPVWCSMDYGFTHPTVVYLLTRNEGKIYIVDEHYQAGWLPRRHAPAIENMLARHGVTLNRLDAFVAGADVFAKGKDKEGKTIADQYEELGIRLEPANDDRINGAGELLELLGDDSVDPPIPHRLEISDLCVKLIECLPGMQHDPRRPEDVLKVDANEDGEGGDDTYDSGRYGVMYSTAPVISGYLGLGSTKSGWMNP